jgi:hypothetical protein
MLAGCVISPSNINFGQQQNNKYHPSSFTIIVIIFYYPGRKASKESIKK